VLPDLSAAPAAPPVEFHVLDANVPLDRATWVQLWENWPDREVMAHPEFVKLFAIEGQQVLAAATCAGACAAVEGAGAGACWASTASGLAFFGFAASAGAVTSVTQVVTAATVLLIRLFMR
jgi:hypothetical protein